MRDKDLERLEFFKVLEKIKEFTNSKATKRFIDGLRPIRDAEHLKKEINVTADFMKIQEDVPICPFDDVEELIKKSFNKRCRIKCRGDTFPSEGYKTHKGS